MENRKPSTASFLRNEEMMFTVFCTGIAVSHIFWTLLNSILCLIFMAYWLFFVKKNFSWKSNKSRWVILFCFLYIMPILGMLYSEDLRYGTFKLQQKSAFLLFPLILGTSNAVTKKLFKRTFNAFTIAVLAGCLFCFGKGVYEYFRTGETENLYGYGLIVLRDMTPLTFSLCCLLAILYLLHSAYTQRLAGSTANFTRALPQLAGAAALLFFLLIFGNRNILLLAFGLCVFYSISLLHKLRNKIIVSLSILAIFAIAIRVNPSLNRQWAELTNFSKENSIQLDQDLSLGRSWGGKQLRVAIWKCSWDVIKQNWVSGVGTGDAQHALQAAYEKRKFYFASRYNRYNTHNQYLQETVTYGIFGLAVFLACLFAPLFVKFYPQHRLFYALFLISFAFACITDTPLDLNKGIIWYSFFNSLIFFTYYNLKLKSNNGTSQPQF